MLNAGLTPLDAIRQFLRSGSRFVNVEAYRKIERTLRKGEPASKAMLEFPSYFPEYHSHLIAAGEQTGSPDYFYKNLSEIIEKKIASKHFAVKESIYPGFTLLFSFFMLPLQTLINQGLAAYLSLSLYPLILSFVIFLFFIKTYQFLYQFKVIKGIVDRIKYAIPIYRKFYLIQYIRAFNALNHAGIYILETMALSASATDNYYFMKKVSKSKSSVSSGRSLYEAFRKINIFPKDFIQILSSAEIAGKIDYSLQKYLELLEHDFEHQLKIYSKILAFLMLMFVIAFVAYRGISKTLNIF